MKSLKILSLLFAFLLAGTTTTLAQSNGEKLSEEQKEEIKKNLEEYAAALNLSEEQKSEFEVITRKYAEKIKALRESDISRRKKFKEMRSIKESKNEEMKELLSKDQYKVYLDKQEEMKKRVKERRKNG